MTLEGLIVLDSGACCGFLNPDKVSDIFLLIEFLVRKALTAVNDDVLVVRRSRY